VALNGVQRENFLRVEPAWGSINLININLILITTMAEIIKNLIIRNLLYWLPGDPCEGQTHVLDFNRKVDLDVYYEGRTPVLEGDNCFDLKPETLGQFLRMLDRKATYQGWNNASSAQQIGLFNITHNGDPTTISITKEHNYIEMAAMIGEDSQHQANQNNQMLKECIWGSLTLRAHQRLAQYKDEYTFNGLCCGPLLLNDQMHSHRE
jgi:hypothetical protein